ncbi:TonB-dependent receptor [Altererythrobacter sp. Z27]|uniref:TonB-dependent receptor n=1 Tax=Altererythrobacter sp. Z27 TaxID=3461147 RepID=UPI00404470EE
MSLGKILSGSVLLVLCPGVALAQSEPAEPGADAVDQGIGDIVVTAQRREERLQEVPAAITALSTDALVKANVVTTEDLGKVTPGFFFGRSNFVSQPTIRGIGTRGANAGDESVTPIFVDGVYQPFQFGALFTFNNVERIEVLKGPQSILYGRNATGGAINIITATPTDETKFKMRASYGNFDTVDIAGYLSGGSGPIAADIAANYYDDNGYVTDLANGGKTGDRKSFAVRSKLRAEMGDLTATLALGYMNSTDHTGASQPIHGNTIAQQTPGAIYGTRHWEAAMSEESLGALTQYQASLTLRYDLGSVAITSITGYQDNKFDFEVDSDASTLVNAGFNGTISSESLYQEIYAQSDSGGPLNWIIGGVYFNDKAAFDELNILSRGNLGAVVKSDLDTDSLAIYGQLTYEMTDQLTLIGGLRYTTEKKTYLYTRIYPSVLAPPETSARFNKLTPSLVAQFQATPELQLYARYSSAFKSGLYASTSAPIPADDPEPVRPETATQYEIGLKSDPAHWLRLNLAAYYTDYDNLQLTARDPVLSTPILTNAAAAKIVGFEADVQIRPTRNFGVTLALSQLDGEYRNFDQGQEYVPVPGGGAAANITNLSGNTLPKAPSTMISASSDYTFPALDGEIRLSGNLSYQSKVYFDPGNNISQDGYVLLGGDITWRSMDERIAVSLYGQNLTNKFYGVGGNIGSAGSHWAMSRPRSYGVRLSFEM